MGELKTQRGAQLRAEAWEEFKNLSEFGDEELLRESRRESIRRIRDKRRAENADNSLARWERLMLVRLMIFGAGMTATVILFGLLMGEVDVVKVGVAGLCTAIGLGFYRLRDVLRHLIR